MTSEDRIKPSCEIVSKEGKKGGRKEGGEEREEGRNMKRKEDRK